MVVTLLGNNLVCVFVFMHILYCLYIIRPLARQEQTSAVGDIKIHVIESFKHYIY